MATGLEPATLGLNEVSAACAPGRMFSCESPSPRSDRRRRVFYRKRSNRHQRTGEGAKLSGHGTGSPFPAAISLARRVWCCQLVSATVVDMNAARRTLFVSVNLTPDARDELRRATLDLTTPVGRRLSMSDVLIGVIRVAMRHRVELVSALAEDDS